jgi:hypothetical protein
MQDAKSYGVPDLESMVILNLWSNGGLWTGDMRIGDSIYLGIEYIELVYNRSSDVSRGPYGPLSENHGGHQRMLPTNDSGNGHPVEPRVQKKQVETQASSSILSETMQH